MNGLLDHLLAVLVAVVVPRLSARPDGALRDQLERSSQLRRGVYLNNVVFAWILATACLWRVEAAEETPAAIGLAPVGPEPGLTIAWIGAALFALWRVLRGRALLRDPARSLEAYDDARATAPFLPRTRREERLWVVVSLTAGLCEEIVYRGFLIGYGLSLVGRELAPPRADDPLAWGVAVAAALAFGGAHAYQGSKGMAKVAAGGAMFGALYLIGGSLWPCILLHAFVDVYEGWVWTELVPRFPLPADGQDEGSAEGIQEDQ